MIKIICQQNHGSNLSILICHGALTQELDIFTSGVCLKKTKAKGTGSHLNLGKKWGMAEKQQVLRKRWTHWKSLHPRSQYHDTGSAVLLITIPSNYSNLIFFQHPCDRQTRGTLVALSCENHKDHQKWKCTKWVVFFSPLCFCLTFPLLLKLTKTPSHAKKLENTWERIHIRPLLMMFQWLCARSVGVCISNWELLSLVEQKEKATRSRRLL